MTDQAHRWLIPTKASPLASPALAWEPLRRVPNLTNCNSHRSHSCLCFPTVTACHMLYCSRPSWEAVVALGSRHARPSASRSGAERAGRFRRSERGPAVRSSLHGSARTAGQCLRQLRDTSALRSHIPCPGFVPGSSWLCPRVWSEAGRSLPCSPSLGMPGCRVGMLPVRQGMLRLLVLAAGKTARGDGTRP